MFEIPLSRTNLGKRSSREKVSSLNQKMRSPNNPPIDFSEGLSFNVGSLLTICGGIMMFAFMTLVGEYGFEEERERERKDGKKMR